MLNLLPVTPELLPCPFCGGSAKVDDEESEDVGGYFASCTKCPVSAWGDIRSEAITAWNTRISHSLPGDVGMARAIEHLRSKADGFVASALKQKKRVGPLAAGFRHAADELEKLAALTPSALSEKVVKPGFQAEVGDWMLECFGPEIAADRLERGDRWTEEALELAQTIPGFTAERAHALVDYVFSRPVGERGQEVGGSMVTLAALCNSFGINIAEEAERELARVWTKIGAIRAKQASKPTGSALPVAVPSALSGDAVEMLYMRGYLKVPCEVEPEGERREALKAAAMLLAPYSGDPSGTPTRDGLVYLNAAISPSAAKYFADLAALPSHQGAE